MGAVKPPLLILYCFAMAPQNSSLVYRSLPTGPIVTRGGRLSDSQPLEEDDSYWSLFLVEELRGEKVLPRQVYTSLTKARQGIEDLAKQLDAKSPGGFWVIFKQGDVYINGNVTLRILEKRY